jgi:oligopeptide/dipeptide ABC transporter ATP-binding protein
MYLEQVVEHGPTELILGAPRHPYTQALLSAVPVPDPARQRTRAPIILSGDPPSPLDPPSGCRFHTRCPIALGVCERVEPALTDPAGGQHLSRCHLVGPDGQPPRIRDIDAPPTREPPLSAPPVTASS